MSEVVIIAEKIPTTSKWQLEVLQLSATEPMNRDMQYCLSNWPHNIQRQGQGQFNKLKCVSSMTSLHCVWVNKLCCTSSMTNIYFGEIHIKPKQLGVSHA